MEAKAASATTMRSRGAEPIVILVPGFPANEQDETCLPAVQNYVRALAAHNTHRRVDVVAFQYPYRHGSYRWHRAVVHAINGRNRGHPYRLLTWKRVLRQFQTIHERNSIGLIHSFWLTECTFVGHWLSRWYDVPHLATIPGQDARSSNPYLSLIDFSKMTIVSGSEFAAETFEQTSGERVDAIIPLGLDLNRPEFPAPGQSSSERPIDLLGIGSLTETKNFSTFIDLVEQLRDEHPSLSVELVGQGPQLNTLKEQVSKRGLDNTVRFRGHLPRSSVIHTMRQSKILLHPARYDAQPYVFLEAVACGMHVACMNAGTTGIKEHIHPCDSRDGLARKLSELLNDDLSYAPAKVPTISETVQRYTEVMATLD